MESGTMTSREIESHPARSRIPRATFAFHEVADAESGKLKWKTTVHQEEIFLEIRGTWLGFSKRAERARSEREGKEEGEEGAMIQATR